PPASGRGQPAGLPRRHAVLAQEAPQPLRLLALFEPHAAQLAAQPAIKAAQLTVRACMTEIRYRSAQVGICLADHLRQADRPIAFGDPAQAILGALQALRRDAESAVGAQPVAEKLAFLDRGNGALLLIDPQPQAASEKAGDRGHDPFAG